MSSIIGVSLAQAILFKGMLFKANAIISWTV